VRVALPEKSSLKDRFYSGLLGETLGSGAREFIQHLGLIGASFAVAKVITGLVSIAAGRLLGPQEYGRINVMASAGAAIAPFMLVGLQYSVVKYGANREERPRVFGSALAAFAALSLLVCCVALLFRNPLAELLHINGRMLFFSLAYAAATAGFLLVSGMQQALGHFSRRGLSEIGFSVTMAVVFAGGIIYLGRIYEAMAWAYITAFGGMAIFWLSQARRHVKFEGFSRAVFARMAEYGFYNFGASLGAVMLLNVQGLVVSAALSARETGIYAAYYTAAISIGGYLAYALTTVLFPKASSTADRRRLWDLAVRSWSRLFVAVLVFFILIELAVLSLMGRHQYGLDLKLVLLFAVCGTLMLVQSSLTQIILAEGIKASRLGLYIAVGCGLLNFAACVVLVPRFGVEGVTLAFILSYSTMIAWLWKVKDSYLSAGEG
jgi:O-antigen/teichoic acid export membrane protein